MVAMFVIVEIAY